MDDVEVDQIPQAFPVVGDVLGERCGRGEKLGDAVAGGLVERGTVVPVGAVIDEVGAVHDTGVRLCHAASVAGSRLAPLLLSARRWARLRSGGPSRR